MPKYYVTFGLRYAAETHPHVPGINPDSYVEVEAISELDARTDVFNIFGDKWAFIYSEKNFNKDSFPNGKFATLDEIKNMKYDTFYYVQNGVLNTNPITINYETEKDHTLTPEQMMVLNNIVNLVTTMATFPRVDKFKSYIMEFQDNISKGLMKEDKLSDKNKKFTESISVKVSELVELLKKYRHLT